MLLAWLNRSCVPGTSSGAPKQGIGQHASIGHQSVSPDSPDGHVGSFLLAAQVLCKAECAALAPDRGRAP